MNIASKLILRERNFEKILDSVTEQLLNFSRWCRNELTGITNHKMGGILLI